MKKTFILFSLLLIPFIAFAQSNANDTQAAIVNSLLIQQLINNQQNQKQENEPTKDKKKSIESEDDLLDLGFKRFKLGDAEDYFVFKASGNTEYEVEIWAVSKRGRLRSYGTILVEGKKGYKGNPLDDDLDQYKSCFLKILNDEDAIIKNLGEKHNDQYFEIY